MDTNNLVVESGVVLSKCKYVCTREIKSQNKVVAEVGDIAWIFPTSIIDDTTKDKDGNIIEYTSVLSSNKGITLITDEELMDNFESYQEPDIEEEGDTDGE